LNTQLTEECSYWPESLCGLSDPVQAITEAVPGKRPSPPLPCGQLVCGSLWGTRSQGLGPWPPPSLFHLRELVAYPPSFRASVWQAPLRAFRGLGERVPGLVPGLYHSRKQLQTSLLISLGFLPSFTEVEFSVVIRLKCTMGRFDIQ